MFRFSLTRSTSRSRSFSSIVLTLALLAMLGQAAAPATLAAPAVPHASDTTPSSWRWHAVFTAPVHCVWALGVYHDKLYAGSWTNGDSDYFGRINSYDGTTWTDTNTALTLGATINNAAALATFGTTFS